MIKEENIVKTAIGTVLAVIAAIILVCAAFGSFVVIDPGYSGVIFNQWTGNLVTVGQGLTPKYPFVTRVQSYPVALRTYTMVKKSSEGASIGDDSLDLPTKEGQHIKQDISVTYNTSEAKAAQVFKAFKGADIEEIEATFIRRTIITTAQNIAGQMSLTDLISTKRDELQNAISKTLETDLAKMGFVLDKVNLGASHLPGDIEKQMQAKMGKQQEAQQAEYELQKQQTLAKAKAAEAEGDAQATLINATAQAKANRLLNETLTSLLIENKKLEKWNGELPTITGGAIPFINMSMPSQEKK